MAATAAPQPPLSESAPNERFFRYFQHEVIALQDQMERIENTAHVGGERADAVDHCLAGIARLSREVKDASSYLPAYDQRTYSSVYTLHLHRCDTLLTAAPFQAIKGLTEKLQETRSRFEPKQKFSFKTARKNNSAISLHDAAEIASAQRLKIPGYRSDVSSGESSFAPTPDLRSPPNEPNGGDETAIRKPSFSHSSSVVVSNQRDVHIVLPSSAANATSSGSLTSLRHCVVDMSVPTASGQPFAGLTLKNIRDSLIVCGHVNGPAHVTGVEDSVVVVACRQFRLHECRNVDVYLLCNSRPIIEDCSAIRFAPLSEHHTLVSEKPVDNQWDQVDDFKWLKAEPSPNWSVLPPGQRIADAVWRDVVPGGPGISLDDIMGRTVAVRS
ncbi:MAG: hypothetical protein M1832_006265 [Thelocarpon impressellum]|nr:MAG: hypothetical protein M1832_006265 [Thelocarpon impressellum]